MLEWNCGKGLSHLRQIIAAIMMILVFVLLAVSDVQFGSVQMNSIATRGVTVIQTTPDLNLASR